MLKVTALAIKSEFWNICCDCWNEEFLFKTRWWHFLWLSVYDVPGIQVLNNIADANLYLVIAPIIMCWGFFAKDPFQYKDFAYQYKNSHYKDKMVS